MVNPEATSTPKIVDIASRRPIGDVRDDSIQSPIPYSESSPTHKSSKSNSEEELDDYVDSNDETDNAYEEEVGNTTFCNCVNPLYFGALIALLSIAGFLYVSSEEHNADTFCTKKLSKEFPSQVEDFWIYIEEGIKDVRSFQRPKTFIFLYNDESQETLEKIVNKISEFATCALRKCTALPVILKADDLSSTDILEDYGKIISKNKKRVQESGVMIIKNLEKVPGTSAQAFHSFCDEFNPVVNEALIIFTMKVNKINVNLGFLEKYLHDRWKDIKDDTFSALFTRIANVVLPIKAER